MPEQDLTLTTMRVELRRCPACRTRLDAATAISRGAAPAKKPRPGDLTICAYCSAVLVFTAAGFRFAAETDLDGIRPELRTIALRLIRDWKPIREGRHD